MSGGSRCTAALLASVMLVTPALAEPRSPSEKDKRAAGELVKKAIAKSQAGDHAAAIVIYLQAYTIVPSSVLLSNIGSEYQQDGKHEEALRYFCMYLENDPSGTNAPYATQQARQLQIQLGKADEKVCAPSRPAQPKEAASDPVEPGPRTETPPPRDPPTAETPARTGGSSTLRYLGIATGIAGVAGLGVGIYAGLEAKQISDDISDHDPSQPWTDIKDLERRGQRYENIQIASLIAGGVLVTGGIVMYLVGRSSGASDASGDKPAVSVAPTRTGLAVFGRF